LVARQFAGIGAITGMAMSVATDPLVPTERRILFHHIGGAGRGMDVEWRIIESDGLVRATILHDLESPYAIIRSRLGEYILGHQVVDYVAGRTLRRMKELVESGTE